MPDFELDTFKRDINLVEYATSRCGYERVRKESSRSSHVLRHRTTDDKIVVAKEQDGHWVYFSVRDEKDNGTIVDFVQRRQNKSIGEIRQELREYLGMPRPAQTRSKEDPPETRPIERDRNKVIQALAAAKDIANNLYLNSRGVRPETLKEPRFAGTFKEDQRGNVLFVHRDGEGVSGYEIKNREFTGFASGGTKALWHSQARPTDNKLVITESAVDALSYHQLHRKDNDRTRYVSIAGAPSPYQLDIVEKVVRAMPAGSTVVAAVDGDQAGTKVAKQVEDIAKRHPEITFKRDSPELALGKDWNDVLQRMERDYIRSLPAFVRGPAKGGPERSR